MGLHAAAFWTFLQAPALRLPRPGESEYRQKIAGKEEKIVYYKFRHELPQVTPPKTATARLPVRAETKAKQTIVSSAKNAPKAPRMVWTPAPEMAPTPRELPNLLAVKLPDPPPRVPDLKPATPLVAAQLPPAALPPKPFTPPPPSAPKPRLAAAPRLAPDAPSLEARELHAALVPLAKLPPKAYVAPTQAPRPVIARAVTLADAPQLAAVAAPSSASAIPYSAKLPPKPFTPPSGAASRQPVATSGKGHALEPPPLDAVSNSRDLNIAIVGLNPNDKASILPSAPSPAQFSAGPVVRPNGADAEGGGKSLSVPGLFVRGRNVGKEKKPDLIAQAYAAPTSEQNLRAALSRGEPMVPAHIEPAPDSRAAATKVSGAPDSRFNGRDVFMMAIQMPNVTSYSGSWLMWYSDHTLHEAGLAPIAPPVPHRKVDPKYIATAVAERVEGRVTLGCVIDRQGHVSGVELIRGIDDRLNRSAEEALSKWEFFPATRKGEPVEVDVLVEIPFRLEPRLDSR
jgi:TonB family protein